MIKNLKNKLLIYRIIMSVLCIATMVYVLLINPAEEPGYTNTVRQLGHFSIISSLFVSYIFIRLLIAQVSGHKKIAPKPEFRGATMVYSGVTALLFIVFFHDHLPVTGFQKAVYYFMHIAFPLILLLDNIKTIPHRTYKYDLLIYWMIFPFYYLIFLIIESYALHFDRYYFLAINDENLSFYPIAILLLIVVFLITAIVTIKINRMKGVIEKIDKL